MYMYMTRFLLSSLVSNKKSRISEMASKPETLNNETALFRDLNPDDEQQESTSIDSVCVNCFKQGQTRLLLTKIPFYKEVVLMSFQCDHCGFQNNEIQSAAEIQPKGCKITLKVLFKTDLNRKIVKSDHTAVSIPEVNLEIPAQSQKGEVTTVEGVIERTINGLTQDQQTRRQEHPETAEAIDQFIKKLEDLKELKQEFTLQLEDISGNCFLENPNSPKADPQCKVKEFERTTEQDQSLGIYVNNHVEQQSNSESNNLLKPIAENSWPLEELHGEILQFQTNCSNCQATCDTNMKLTNIPHFKEVVIMATNCDVCGCRTNEVKAGGGTEPLGTRFEVLISTKDDLTRDVLKSETCAMSIPELELSVGSSALGGRFTTVEGVLLGMKDQIMENGAMFHDSADDNTKQNFKNFIADIDAVLGLTKQVTLVLDDPAGNSYVQSLDVDVPDSKLNIIKYIRTFEQNEELGLNDMKTENYEVE